jgi:hypothetical protein
MSSYFATPSKVGWCKYRVIEKIIPVKYSEVTIVYLGLDENCVELIVQSISGASYLFSSKRGRFS